MTFGGDDSGRTRGSDGRMYDSKQQADRGYQAHENRAQTAARRTKWKAQGVLGQFAFVPKITYYAVVNGMKKLFNPSELAQSLARVPEDIAKLPKFTKAVFRNAFRPVTSRVSRDESSNSKRYSRRRDD
ncbi:hypothetical protein [Haloarcula sp. JP-L23]|uniref:hypothetical protein n=1 Tax=Haloarcula sp. JP-L23 TaxID=2716717 RepID=UPI00140EFF70|nr:hypothetical protein G9465_24495 [Haloarcula sp. JP-L23]